MARRNGTATYKSMGELLCELGGISANRVCLDPPPGRATEKELLWALDHTDKIYELVEGTLVEKVMGLSEAGLAIRLGRYLDEFAEEHGLGLVAGEAGTVRLFAGLVRIPDVLFVSFEKLPGKTWPARPIPDLVPDLAVEVISTGNTPGEMRRKLKDYFLAGVSLVWLINPAKRTVRICTAPDKGQVIRETETLTGGTVLPGFTVPLRKIFAGQPPAAPKKSRR